MRYGSNILIGQLGTLFDRVIAITIDIHVGLNSSTFTLIIGKSVEKLGPSAFTTETVHTPVCCLGILLKVLQLPLYLPYNSSTTL